MPVILFFGDNTLDIEAAARAVRSRFNDVDTIRYDGATVGLPELAQTCQTVGLFDPERLVVVRNLHERIKGARKEGESEAIRRFLGNVAPTTTLLLLSPEMDDKGQLVDMVREVSGDVRSFNTPKRGDLPRWIVTRSKVHGATIGRDAAGLLAEMIGSNAVMIDSELEKLATYAGEGGAITAEMVEMLVGTIPQDSIFSLVDAVAAGDHRNALRLLHAQMESSSSGAMEFALPLIRMLARQVRILVRIRLGQRAGLSRNQIMTNLKINRYFADRYFQQAAHLSVPQLVAAFEQLAAFEHALKSGRADAAIGLDLLVVRLCA
jgi:DNA polymerase III subunit delta